MSFKQALAAAYKDSKISKSFGNAAETSRAIRLNRTQASEFIDDIADKSQVLGAIRIVKMPTPIYEVSRILEGERFLRPGNTAVTDDNAYTNGLESFELQAKKVRGHFDINDDDLQDNIEGQALEDKLYAHAIQKIRNELAEIAFLSDTTSNPSSGNEVLKLFKGFLQRFSEGNSPVVNAGVGFANTNVSRNLFRKAVKSLPAHLRHEASFFLHDDLMIDYNGLFDESYNRKDMINNIVGKPAIITDPLQEVGGKYTSVFSHPKNLILGILNDSDISIEFETERIPDKDKTRVHFRMRMDTQVENPKAAAVIKNVTAL